ncbi:MULTISPECIES: hypothetical protein [unclassified Corynebacterium]|uniref:hypothetical protein n=1 Tax=unclassified Corynebacterium TaxID=2624378 RepID=UPI0029CA71C1|nr:MULTISPECIES: hypothetical protein [unclassified Corynebacterium]WPF66124.1 hypothetical protein OLX12_11350 [Corynebacterium sp. 22KM0430]WPF68616.1 hypothetical protein OLW90_11345 [Corynebacterium sp. 21KM1197]
MMSKKLAVASFYISALIAVAIFMGSTPMLYLLASVLFLDLLLAVILSSKVERRWDHKSALFIYAAMVLVGVAAIVILESFPGMIMTVSVAVELLDKEKASSVLE